MSSDATITGGANTPKVAGAEGVPPAMIENLARQAGMPVGPLSLSDEVAIDLVRTVVVDLADGTDAAVDPGQKKLLDTMVLDLGRLGRGGAETWTPPSRHATYQPG